MALHCLLGNGWWCLNLFAFMVSGEQSLIKSSIAIPDTYIQSFKSNNKSSPHSNQTMKWKLASNNLQKLSLKKHQQHQWNIEPQHKKHNNWTMNIYSPEPLFYHVFHHQIPAMCSPNEPPSPWVEPPSGRRWSHSPRWCSHCAPKKTDRIRIQMTCRCEPQNEAVKHIDTYTCILYIYY